MKLKVLQEGTGLPLPHPNLFRNKDVRLLFKMYPSTVGTPIPSSLCGNYPGIWACAGEVLDSVVWNNDAWAIVEWEDSK